MKQRVTFACDGLNRQVSRSYLDGTTYYRVYDGWDLIGDYASGAANPVNAYLYGTGGLIKNLVSNNYYYQDALGSTSHLSDATGKLVEAYRYTLQGTPTYLAPNGTVRTASSYNVRHLFAGQQYYDEIDLYDLRNRYYSSDFARFLQADPIGFGGDATNLYRYCGNNPVMRSDSSGLGDAQLAVADEERVIVTPGRAYLGAGINPFGRNGESLFGPGGSYGFGGHDDPLFGLGVSGAEGAGGQTTFGDQPLHLTIASGVRQPAPEPILPHVNPFPPYSPTTGYSNPIAAGAAVLNAYNSTSIALNLEGNGFVYPVGSLYYATPPAWGTRDSSNALAASQYLPGGVNPAAFYHMHGNFSINVDGQPVATGLSIADDYNSNNFSEVHDIPALNNAASLWPGFQGYLGTPSGAFKGYDPATGKVYDLPGGP